jgi:hypothetical protein
MEPKYATLGTPVLRREVDKLRASYELAERPVQRDGGY